MIAADTRLTRVRQSFPERRLADLEATLARELPALADRLAPGRRIAVAVGSRGIRDIVPIVGQVVAFVKERGAEPFLVPAMGSHGGASAEGQRAILEGYGITAESVGAPIRSSMETVEIARGECSCAVYMDRLAHESDGVILVNRIKPHTDYRGSYDSGLVKMCVIGLGKHAQALEIHRRGIDGLKVLMPAAARDILRTGAIVGGIGIVEDAYDNTMAVRALPAERIMADEPGLLELARENMPRLPLDDIDVLVVDRLGKDISGVGMDPNIIGRMAIRGEPEFERPRVKSIIVRDVSEGSHGNALGIGLADIITRRLYEKIDFAPMYENVYTSTFLERAKVPVVAETDAKALAFALRASWLPDPADAIIVRIADTLHIDSLLVSPSGLRALQGHDRVRITDESMPLLADEESMADL